MKTFTLSVWLFSAALAFGASSPIIQSPVRGVVSGGSFTANTATFSFGNSLSRNANLTGIANSKIITISVWVKVNVDGTEMRLLAITDSSSTAFVFYRLSSNKMAVFARNSALTAILSISGSTSILSSGGWYHVYACVDLADTSKRKIYVNGVAETLSVTTYTNDTMWLAPTTPKLGIGVNPVASSAYLDGALSELWFDDSYLDDPTKFASGGHPISLGSTGQLPTGTAPGLYMSLNGSGNSWAVDSSGNGNTFTVTGTLGSTTPP